MTTKKMTKTIVLSDVDGTLVKGSLVLGHAVFLHETGILDMGDAAEAWKNDKKNEELIGVLAEKYKKVIAGHTVEDLKVDEFIEDLLADEDNFYSTLNRLREYREQGTPVLLISGSPDFLVGRFAEAHDFDYTASIYARDEFGRFTGDCIGMFSRDAKREFIANLDLSDYDDVVAFGDTKSDSPLFESARYSVLVQPTPVTFFALRHLVHEIVDK